jgi:4-aminobutyrate aminotransferase
MSAVYQLPEPIEPEVEPTSAEWLARDEAALAGVLPRITDVVAVRGEGSWLWDADGRRYLDFGSGIAVTNTGHCHPRVVAAITEQAATLIHTSVVAHPTGMIRLAERLAGLVPFMAEPQVFFCNSGAEAVDGSLKLARKVTGKPGVIAFRRAFHGRTLAATSLTTAKGKYREGYEPLLPAVTIAPYGDLDGLDELFTLQAPGANIGAMIVEPVLGEGGYVVPPVAWLAGLRERCDRHGILLIFDEVQTGVGRTGRPFAAETFGVAPDVILFAKGIASGLPLGGIIAPRDLMDRWPTGSHGSTFGGNPVSCAAALATLDVLDDEGCYDRARRLGRIAVERLGRLASEGPGAGPVDVRGVGLMIGVELADKDTAEAVQARCLDEGLIVLLCGPEENVLRLIPPLTIADDEFEEGLDILVAALESEA